MQLKEFRVQMYRCIIDSGWIDVSPLTVLVGKNEVGKTSLLKALHKLNPYQEEPYVIDSEWPRGRRQERRPDQVACTARFELTDDETRELGELTSFAIDNVIIEVSRNYAGHLIVEFQHEESLRLSPQGAEKISAMIPALLNELGEEFKRRAQKGLQDIRQSLSQDTVLDLTRKLTELGQSLQASFSPGNALPGFENEEKFVAKLNEAAKAVDTDSKSFHEKVSSWVQSKLPTFIYMSDYRAFNGTAQLDQIKQRKDRNQMTEEDKTVLMLMGLSGLELEEEVRKGNLADREQRQYDLDDASATLTRTISQRWSQKKYEVQFRADGQLFYTFVKDQKDPSLIKLEERSQGFQWFFSFDLMFMYESKGTFKGCVILLDEPGLHLHPDAQRDLLKRLQEYAKDNCLVYTTHLPFLIDLQKPETIRVLNETNQGTVVSSDLTQSQPEARFVLQAALGMSGSSSYLLSQKNLVIEGVDDYWIITQLSNIFKRSDKPGLPDDLFITPAGGASEAAYIAIFMVGQKLDVVVLLDSDKAGKVAHDSLVKRWLTRYDSSSARVLSLGPSLGVFDREFSIEDIFPDDFYLERVHRVYHKELTAAGVTRLELTGSDKLRTRVERALSKIGVSLNRGSVAKLIRKDLVAMKSSESLPPRTRENAAKLVEEITNALR